jgi:hypothetical protein
MIKASKDGDKVGFLSCRCVILWREKAGIISYRRVLVSTHWFGMTATS